MSARSVVRVLLFGPQPKTMPSSGHKPRPPVPGSAGKTKIRPRRRWLDRAGWYEVSEAAIESTTRQAECLNPALVHTTPAIAGPVLGIDVDSGQAVTHDIHELYAAGRISSPVALIAGDVGMGKSALLKTAYVLRPLALGRQVAVYDRKVQHLGQANFGGEYAPLASALGHSVIRFSRRAVAGRAKVNLLDPRITGMGTGEEAGQDQLLVLAAEMAHGPLNARERHALRAAHRSAIRRAQADGRVAHIGDVVEALFDPNEEAVPHPATRTHGVDVKEIARWGLDLALDLARFIEGDLSGLVDGPTSENVDLDSPLLVIDISDLDEHSAAMGLVMSTMNTFLQAVWSRRPGRQRIIVVEEGYHLVATPGAAAILRANIKRGRGTGTAVVTALHHLSDIPSDSEAMSVIREAQVLHIYGQATAQDTTAVCETFHLPSEAGGLIESLRQGVHIYRLGREAPRLIQHLRSRVEERITDTDGAMLGRTEGLAVDLDPIDLGNGTAAAVTNGHGRGL